MSLIEITYDKEHKDTLDKAMSDINKYYSHSGYINDLSLEQTDDGDYVLKTDNTEAALIVRSCISEFARKDIEKELHINHNDNVDTFLNCLDSHISRSNKDKLKTQLRQVLLNNKECWPLFVSNILKDYHEYDEVHIESIFQSEKDTLVKTICWTEEGIPFETQYLSMTQRKELSEDECIEYLMAI